MTKREKTQFIKHVWEYLQLRVMESIHASSEVDFDWYNDAQEVFFQALCDRPIKIPRRIKPIQFDSLLGRLMIDD